MNGFMLVVLSVTGKIKPAGDMVRSQGQGRRPNSPPVAAQQHQFQYAIAAIVAHFRARGQAMRLSRIGPQPGIGPGARS
jgi:hypothetical protein